MSVSTSRSSSSRDDLGRRDCDLITPLSSGPYSPLSHVIAVLTRNHGDQRRCGAEHDLRGANIISTDGNKAVIRRLFDELWGTGDVSAADRFYAPGQQLEELKAFATDLYVAIPDWRVTIDELIGEDDKVVVRWTGRGTNLGSWDGAGPTGLPVMSTGIDIERLVDGMIVEEHGEVDMLGFLRQLDGNGEAAERVV